MSTFTCSREFDSRPIAPKPLLEGPLGALLEWQP
jgi:hypothetical protein